MGACRGVRRPGALLVRGPIAAGLFGVAVFAVGCPRNDRLGDPYRFVGAGLVVATLLFAVFEQWAYARIALEASTVGLAMGIGAVGAVAGTWRLERAGTASNVDVGWTVAGTAALVLGGLLLLLVGLGLERGRREVLERIGDRTNRGK
ncbi:hypothetical protein ACYJ1Y_01050 [Natrialbaceae archaeon A-gly3]